MRRILTVSLLLISLCVCGSSLKQSAWRFDNATMQKWKAAGFRSWTAENDSFTAEFSNQNCQLFSPDLELEADKYEYVDIFYHLSGTTALGCLYFSEDGKSYPHASQIPITLETCETFYPAKKTFRVKDCPEWKGIIRKLRWDFPARNDGSILKLYGIVFRSRKDTLKNGSFLFGDNVSAKYWEYSQVKGSWHFRIVPPDEDESGNFLMSAVSENDGEAEISADLPHIRQEHTYEASFFFKGNGRIDASIVLYDRTGKVIQNFALTSAEKTGEWVFYKTTYEPSASAFCGKLIIKMTAGVSSHNYFRDATVEYKGCPYNWRAEWIWGSKPAQYNQDCYFRREFEIDDPDGYSSALLQATCDDQFKLNLNGKCIAASDNWIDPRVLEILPELQKGKNVFSVSAKNNTSVAGLLVELKLTSKNGESSKYIVSDDSWLCSENTPDRGWESPDFNINPSQWKRAYSYGCPPVNPWSNVPYSLKLTNTPPSDAIDKNKYLKEKTICKINTDLNYPRLEINGKINAPFIFGACWLGDARQSFADSVGGGFNIYRIPWEFNCAWCPDGTIDMSSLDKIMEQCLNANPDAYVILPFRISAPGWWIKQNPDELTLFSDNTVTGHYGILPSTASEKWKQDSIKFIRLFLEHAEKQWYASRIIGYMPCSHSGPEWVITTKPSDYPDYSKPMQKYFRNFLRKKYSDDLALLRKSWNNLQVTFDNAQIPQKGRRDSPGAYILAANLQDVIDYNRCLQESVGDAIIEFSKVIREYAPNKINVLYYGYLATLAGISIYPATTGHYDVMRVINSGLTEMFASPVSYLWRRPGDVSGCGSVETSYRLHNIIWLQEADNRSNLTVDSYSHKNTANLRDSLAENRREFVYAMTKRMAIWFYDMTGGWYSNQAYYDDFRMMRKLYEKAYAQPVSWQTPVAVFFDEKSLDGLSLNREKWGGNNAKLMHCQFIQGLAKAGIPYDTFEQEDIYRINPDNYKCYIFINAWRYDEKLQKFLKDKIYKNANTIIWIYAPGAGQNVAGTDAMSAMTGITLAKGTTGGSLAFRIESSHAWFKNSAFENFIAGIKGIYPAEIYQVTDPAAEILGRYLESKETAFALKRNIDHNIVYMSSPDDTGRIWRQIFRQIGLPIFINTADRICFDGKFLGISLLDAPGTRRITLPDKSEVWDVFNGKQISGNCREFEFAGSPGDVMLYYLGNIKELE